MDSTSRTLDENDPQPREEDFLSEEVISLERRTGISNRAYPIDDSRASLLRAVALELDGGRTMVAAHVE